MFGLWGHRLVAGALVVGFGRSCGGCGPIEQGVGGQVDIAVGGVVPIELY
jgi:hypothetical protein